MTHRPNSMPDLEFDLLSGSAYSAHVILSLSVRQRGKPRFAYHSDTENIQETQIEGTRHLTLTMGSGTRDSNIVVARRYACGRAVA